MLFRALRACGAAGGGAGAPDEYLNPRSFGPQLGGLGRIRCRFIPFDEPHLSRVIMKASTRSVRHVLRRIDADFTRDDGTLVLKVMWGHFSLVLLDHGLDLDVFGAPITWVRLRRIDRVQQAVSLVRARQTRSWNSDQRKQGVPAYDAAQITEELENLEREDQEWDAYLSACGADPLEITYEELDADYEGTVRRVLDHIGASDAVVPPRQISRQADQINAEWVERYLSESDG